MEADFSWCNSPVKLLVLLHKAFKRELADLTRLVVKAGGAFGVCGCGLELVELKSRLEFFRSVYKYYCDANTENVGCTDYLQHHGSVSMFESVLSRLNGLLYPTQGLQELVSLIGTLRDSICHYIFKEETQVFPLLMRHFTDDKHASLVWQFMCSFPVMLLENIFSWLTNLLSPEELLDLKDCISNILTRNESTKQELKMVLFWIDKASKRSQDSSDQYDRSSECPQEHNNLRDMSNLFLLKNGPYDCLLLWHSAIKFDLEVILKQLDQARLQKSRKTLSVGSINQIKFLNEVLIFYSDILEKTFYPLLEEYSLHQPSPLYTSFSLKDQVEGLQKILYDAHKIHVPMFLETLCTQMGSLVLRTTEHISFHKTVISRLIIEKCNHKSQLDLLISSLHTLPLGLLKCMVTWFSSHLTKDELNFILHGIEQSLVVDEPFASLLHELLHAGYTGKTSTENVGEIFDRRVPFMSELKRSRKDPGIFIKQECLSYIGSPIDAVSDNLLEPRPMDLIYYFHKALKKDLESFVIGTTKLFKDSGLLMEFTQHFDFVRSLYELHSDTEDKIAFPALEENPIARNITKSYSIDHEMDAKYFDRVSVILAELSGLFGTVSLAPLNYHRLCLELKDSCKSLKKILEDHFFREEIELWPLFREYFSIPEQEKILGNMLGRTGADILEKMMVWLMAHLSLGEKQAMMNYWLKATYCTKFNEWLGEWWDNIKESEKSIMGLSATSSVNIDCEYLSRDVSQDCGEYLSIELLNNDYKEAKVAKKMESLDSKWNQLSKPALVHQQTKHLVYSQVDQVATTKRMSENSRLDQPENSQVLQNQTTSLYGSAETHPDLEDVITTGTRKLKGQCPSYQDIEGTVFGCKHYKQNCKLVASCCNRIFTCRRCHDEEVNDHVMDRTFTTQMMCMRCLEVQPVGRSCSTPSCDNYSMATYFCQICLLFADEMSNLCSLLH